MLQFANPLLSPALLSPALLSPVLLAAVRCFPGPRRRRGELTLLVRGLLTIAVAAALIIGMVFAVAR